MNVFESIANATKPKWYVVPPYKNEGWKVLNQKGEHVATFEDRHDAELAARLFNNHKTN